MFACCHWACETCANACFVLNINDTTIRWQRFTVEVSFLLVILLVIWVRLEHAARAFLPEDRFITFRFDSCPDTDTFSCHVHPMTRSHSFRALTPRVLFCLVLLVLALGPSLVLPQVNELISCFADRVTREQRARAPSIASCKFQPILIECIALLIIAPIYRWWCTFLFCPF